MIIVARSHHDAEEYAAALGLTDATLVDTSTEDASKAVPKKAQPDDVVLYGAFWLGEHWDTVRQALEDRAGVPYEKLKQA